MRYRRPLGPRRAIATNPRRRGTDLRSRNLNPRVLGTNPRALSDAARKAGEALQAAGRAAQHQARIDARERSRERLGRRNPSMRYFDSEWRRWKVDYLERTRCQLCDEVGWVSWVDDDGLVYAEPCAGVDDEPP